MSVVIRFLGHSFFRVCFNRKTVLIDPFVCAKHPQYDLKRLVPYVSKERDLKNVDIVLVSHEHPCHFDKELLERLAQENNACIIGHESVLQKLDLSKRYVHDLDIGQTLSVRGLTLTGLSAHHPQSFYPLGFLVQGKGKSVYHAGDTQLLDSFEGLTSDVALLPIGGHFTMDCVDAVRAVKAMKPTYAIPMHYNTFETIQADPYEFKQKIDKSILKTIPIVLKPGQSFRF